MLPSNFSHSVICLQTCLTLWQMFCMLRGVPLPALCWLHPNGLCFSGFTTAALRSSACWNSTLPEEWSNLDVGERTRCKWPSFNFYIRIEEVFLESSHQYLGHGLTSAENSPSPPICTFDPFFPLSPLFFLHPRISEAQCIHLRAHSLVPCCPALSCIPEVDG